MAYQTGSGITTLDALLDALMDFAEANSGFTKETTITGPGGDYVTDMYVLSRTIGAGPDKMYWWFLGKSGTDGEYGTYGRIEMRMQKTAPTLANRENLIADSPSVEGQTALTRTFLYDKPNGTYSNYYMFGDSNGVHCAIKVSSSSNYSHVSFGVLEKYGTWTGGEYVSGNDLNVDTGYSVSSGFSNLYTQNFQLFGARDSANGTTSYLYYPYESHGDEFDWSAFHMAALTKNRRTLPAASPSATYSVGGDMLHDASPSAAFNRSAMFPVYMRVYDNRSPGGTQKYILVGHVSGARIINCSDIDPTTIVDTDWMVFPQYMKSGSAFTAPVSGLHGLAFRK